MKKPIAIIAGEPNSISSEIIFKSWKQRKRYKSKPIIIIGSFKILNAQNKKLKYKINLRKVTKEFKNINFNNLELLVYDVFFNQKKPFDKISTPLVSSAPDSFAVRLRLVSL